MDGAPMTPSPAPNAVVQVPAHSHCEICHKAIKQGERFCGSQECKDAHEQQVAEKKKAMWKFIAIIAGLMVFFMLLQRGYLI